MKKMFLFVSLGLIMGLLAACGSDDTSSSNIKSKDTSKLVEEEKEDSQDEVETDKQIKINEDSDDAITYNFKGVTFEIEAEIVELPEGVGKEMKIPSGFRIVPQSESSVKQAQVVGVDEEFKEVVFAFRVDNSDTYMHGLYTNSVTGNGRVKEEFDLEKYPKLKDNFDDIIKSKVEHTGNISLYGVKKIKGKYYMVNAMVRQDDPGYEHLLIKVLETIKFE